MAARGDRLEITVIECKKLENRLLVRKTYVELEYNGFRYQTEICKGRGKNPKFGDKFEIPLIDNLRGINVSVWNSEILGTHIVGSGRIDLARVLRKGYDDSTWQLQTSSSRHAGEIRLIMHYPNGLNSLRKAVAVFFSLIRIAGSLGF